MTAHCPNPGAMTGVATPGARVWVEPNHDPGRKLAFTWRLVALPDGHMAGIDATLPNRLAGAALTAGAIPELAGYQRMRAEVRYGRRSRVDFLLNDPARGELYVEVKNVHLRRTGGLAEFPDCVTARGARHLDELAEMARAGHRAVMLYVVQRTDCTALALARDIDPGYAAAFARARAAGVEALAWSCRIAPQEIALDHPIPITEDRFAGP